MMVLLGREVSQFVELGSGKLAVVGNDHEMVLDQAEDLHREPQPLAGIGVAGGRAAPTLDVIGFDLGKNLFEQLAAEQLLGARAAGDRGLELVVGHLSLWVMRGQKRVLKPGGDDYLPGLPLRDGRHFGLSYCTGAGAAAAA